MCGRYYVDEEMAAEIRKIVRDIDLKLNGHREIFPTNQAPVIRGENEQLNLDTLAWGFKHWDKSKGGVLINARAETILERRIFKDSANNRRCIRI